MQVVCNPCAHAHPNIVYVYLKIILLSSCQFDIKSTLFKHLSYFARTIQNCSDNIEEDNFRVEIFKTDFKNAVSIYLKFVLIYQRRRRNYIRIYFHIYLIHKHNLSLQPLTSFSLQIFLDNDSIAISKILLIHCHSQSLRIYI